jgi:hypothetical protein
MGKSCFDCGKKLSFVDAKVDLKRLRSLGYSDKIIVKMTNDDVVCVECSNKLAQKEEDRKLEAIIRSNTNPTLPSNNQTLPTKKSISKKTDVSPTSTKKESKTRSSSGIDKIITSSESAKTYTPSMNLSKYTSADQLRMMTKTLHDQTKSQWEKNGVVQYKDTGLVILQRMWGQQVQFIVACSQVTKEGYRLVAIDEGKSGGQASGGFTGGVNAYFYFQKMDYVR